MARLHPRFGVPSVATLILGGFGLALCLVPLKLLITILGSATIAYYLWACLGVLRGRMAGLTAHAAYRMPLFPLAPLAGLMVLAAIVWTSLGDVSGRTSLAVTAAIMVMSALYYRLALHGKGRWAHRGPTPVAS